MSKPSTKLLCKSHHTDHCLASQICDRQFSTKCFNVTGNISLVVKGNKCQIIRRDASECKELKSKTIDNNKLWVLWTTKPQVKRSMHVLQQRVLSINSQLILRIGIKLSPKLCSRLICESSLFVFRHVTVD